MDFERWNYPHVDTLMHQQSIDTPSEPEVNSQLVEPVLSPEELGRQEEQFAYHQALNQHLNVISEISHKLSEQYKEINETFLNNVIQLIKKITEAVIRKELSADLNHDRLRLLIQNAMSDIQQGNEPCVIYLSNDEYDYFSTLDNMPAGVSFRACPTLKPGDFRVKTASSEVQSILDNQLHDLFGLSHK